jgi:pyruvate dehydrogenase E2 component (dihydrolipoamide acetyltransferase)
MIHEFTLPDVGEGVAEGELVAWHVEVGDEVTEDQVVAEVETDKAVVDVPSPVDGVVKELRADVGQMVPVGDVLLTFEVADEEGAASAGAAEEAAAGEGQAGTEPAEAEATAGEADASAGEAAAGDADDAEGGRVFAAPSVRRLAREEGVRLAAVEGSGPGGRITADDVRAAAEVEGEAEAETDAGTAEAPAATTDAPSATTESTAAGETTEAEAVTATAEAGAQAATGAGGAAVESADRERTLAAPATRKRAREADIDIDAVPTDREREGQPFVTPAEVEAYADRLAEGTAATDVATAESTSAAGGGGTGATTAPPGTREETAAGPVSREPYRGVRRTIGEKMEESVSHAAHVSHQESVVVDALVDAREQLKPEAEAEGVALTYTPFVLKAVVRGLQAHPKLNSRLDEEAEEIVYHEYYDIGIAVDTEAGLMVPVVEGVDEMGLLELAATVADLAERARERNLSPAELQGGTFTVSNYGAIGGEFGTPIINYPETAILGLGAIDERPVAEDGEVVARTTLPLSLSFDHRVIDGADAARFVNTVMEALQHPIRLLL